MIKVCIAEKPNVAKSIAKVLGVRDYKDGYIEGDSPLLECHVFVTWTFGHLCELKTPGEYNRRWSKWNLRNLPMIPSSFGIRVKDDEGIKKQFNTIKMLLEQCDECINCGDAGQEGELIQRYVLQQAGFKKPVKRLWISSLTDEAIKNGFRNLDNASKYDNVYRAALCRSIGDWLVGMNATQYQTLISGNRSLLYSVGRVQTPTLALIVNRQKEIDAFVPEKYYDFTAICQKVKFEGANTFKDKKQAEEVFKKIKDLPMVISKVEHKKQSEKPPQLFDLTSLQVEMNKKNGWSADDTLNTLQSLYEKQLVTYPRVDTRYLPEDMYEECKRILSGLISDYDCEGDMPDEIKKSRDIFDNKKITDHHAIIPTGKWDSNITSEEHTLYDVIARRLLCAFARPFLTANTYVESTVGDEKFKASGRTVLDMGWREIARIKSEDEPMPEFVKGKEYNQSMKLNSHTTKAPAYYTEATLLRAMETAGKMVTDEEMAEAMKENGIGRPSTRAAILELLFKRKYLIRDGKSIKPTATGIYLIDHIKDPILKSPELTGQWECKLRKIERGEYDPKKFKEELYDFVKDIVKK